MRPTRGHRSGQPYPLIWPCSRQGLPCLPPRGGSGGLLPHLFTLTPSTLDGAVCFLWHFPSACAGRVLPGVLPYGARTFLSTLKCCEHLPHWIYH